MADFGERMRHLIDSCGAGTLRVEVTVDQLYAKYQELRDDLVLHGGGQHHYLRDSLYDPVAEHMRTLAASLVTPAGSDIKKGAERVSEAIAQQVYERAPFEFGDLKASPHPVVLDAGVTIYDRPPAVHRLSDAELEAKGDLRRLGFGNQGMTGDVRAAMGAG